MNNDRVKREGSIGVFAAIKNREGKYLLVKHNYGDKKWSLPGGGLEQGELMSDAGIRETLEESGLGIEIIRLVGMFSLLKSFGHVILFEAEVVGGNLKIDGDGKETERCGFFTINEIEKEEIFPAQLSLLMWTEMEPRKDGLPYEGWLTVPPRDKSKRRA